MKIHQRLYIVRPPRPLAPPTAAAVVSSSSAAPLSRVRSNSASRTLHTLPLFFDGPPTPPSSRPSNLVVSSRLTVEVKPEIESHNTNSPYSHSSQNSSQSQSHPPGSGQPPYPLAFTSSQSDATPSHFHPYSNHHIFFPYPALGPFSTLDTIPPPVVDSAEQSTSPPRTRYHLDVGAYGIPKHSRDPRIPSSDPRSNLPFTTGAQTVSTHDRNSSAVLVGEDAYFVRDNAMGVADGVGGWSRVNKNVRVDGSSPSALFAQRLMNYCYQEVDAAMTSSDTSQASPLESDLQDQLEDSLEDLSDGLDVLMILERAYDKTMKAHTAPPSSHPRTELPNASESKQGSTVLPPAASSQANGSSARVHHSSNHPPNTHSPASPSITPTPSPSSSSPPLASSASAPATTAHGSPKSGAQVRSPRNPLLQGSATALLAVLDHPPSPSPQGKPSPRSHQLSSSLSSSSSSLLFPKPRHQLSSPYRSDLERNVVEPVKDNGAVIRIAHLGDCMGMLIRGDEVVWRTEEMWWNFNTPVQLGPLSSTRPQDAKVFTIPVQADDILVLASDGLSDNLWDEDILDEVVRFRRSFLPPSTAPSASLPPATSSSGTREGILGRRTLAGMLSEALCSRARAVSERRGSGSSSRSVPSRKGSPAPAAKAASSTGEGGVENEEDEVPFARRAREQGKLFRGGKLDDISVLIAVVSPVETSKIPCASS